MYIIIIIYYYICFLYFRKYVDTYYVDRNNCDFYKLSTFSVGNVV